MPIISFCEATDEGAIGQLHDQDFPFYRTEQMYGTFLNKFRQEEVKYGPFVYYIKYTHHGLCIKERESNGYHDSDFFMLVWNEEKQAPEEIMFASTRGWTYPCYGSSVDATEETMNKYNAWCAKKREEYRIADRKAKAIVLRKINNQICEVSRNVGASPQKLLKLRKIVDKETFTLIMKLLTANLRSKFRISLRNQVIEWIKNNNGYDKPLSSKQMNYL